MSIPSPGFSYFDLGPLRVHFYALFILAGIAVAVWLASRRLVQRGGPPGVVLDIALWAVPFGIVGGRFYHVATHPSDYFFPGANLLKIFAVWEGGLAIFGAILLGGVGAYLACRRSGIRFLSFADALAPGMLIAQAMGRLGNYFNHELYGAPTILPWGLQIESTNPAFPADLPIDTLFQPLFLYEMIWNLTGVAIILLVERRLSLRWGKAIGLYFIWYGIGRTWLEALRLDPTEYQLLGLKINMVTAMTIALIGLVLIVIQQHRHPQTETSIYLPGRDPRAGVPSSTVEPSALPKTQEQARPTASSRTDSSTTTSEG